MGKILLKLVALILKLSFRNNPINGCLQTKYQQISNLLAAGKYL
jgi:hypothetical protein